MDKSDRQMLGILCKNPRTTYKEIAKQLHLSIPAVQHRFLKMEESNLINGFHALVNLDLLGGIRTMVFGQMTGKLDKDVLEKIASQGSISYMWCGSLNNIYLMAVLHRITELDEILRFAQLACRIPNPEVFIIGSGSIIANCPPITREARTEELESISDLDYRIIRSMHYDARKPIADIAKEIGVSTKTVRRHLSRMMEKSLIDLVTRGKSKGRHAIDFTLFVKVRTADARPSILKKMRDDPQFYLLNSWSVSNAPNQLYFEIQTETVDEMENIVADLRKMNEVESVLADFNLEEHIFETWRDKMLECESR